MKKYVKIQTTRGSMLFNLYPFQEETLSDLQKYNNNIILKSRQMGISTLVAAYCLYLLLFNKDQNILIISLKELDAMDVLSKVAYANDNLPSWLKIPIKESNKKSLKFSNGSKIRVSATTKKSGVGAALNLIVIDECGLIEEANDLWASASPTLSTGGRAILLSTPRGVGSFFHKMWVEAEEGNRDGVGKNGFHPIRLPWDRHPERDKTWREMMGAKQPSEKEAAREFDCNFETSGDSVIDLSTIEFYKTTFKSDPVEHRYVDRSLWLWKYPDYTQQYIVSADTSRGDSNDFSACHVINVATLEQCAEYKGLLSPKEYGNLLVNIATEYNNAIIVPERENVGFATIQSIIDRNYPNLFYSSADLKYVDVHRQLTNRVYSEDQKMVPGISTNSKTRPLIIAHLEQYFRERTVKICSTRTLNELETFIWKNGKAQAMDGYNDDLIMALGIGLWVRDTALRLRQEGIDLAKATLMHINQSELDSTPFYNHHESVKGQEMWRMKTGRQGYGNQNTEDIRWLL